MPIQRIVDCFQNPAVRDSRKYVGWRRAVKRSTSPSSHYNVDEEPVTGLICRIEGDMVALQRSRVQVEFTSGMTARRIDAASVVHHKLKLKARQANAWLLIR